MTDKYIRRYLENPILEDLKNKMVFISGPRQSGKTTLAKRVAKLAESDESKIFYLTWDSYEDRREIIQERFPAGSGVIILDEIHKFTRWRQVVKGLYDKRKKDSKIIVTGSGRLDYYRHGGDSLQGRYNFYRLHPFSYQEIKNFGDEALKRLLLRGGFPEPFISNSDREANRWRLQYNSRLIYEDLNSLENVKDVALIELLASRLPGLTGSPLSINALREDLQVSHKTVARWLKIFENLFLIFRIYPFGAPRIRSVKKEAKHYHFDWALIEDEGIRFENMIATHLLKWANFQEDYNGIRTELRFFRTREGKEVDFVIVQKNKPTYFIECKLRNKEPASTLKYLKKQFPDVPAAQVSFYGSEDVITKEGIRLVNAKKFLDELI
jgi:predicted AAA+ superfamily ATPase